MNNVENNNRYSVSRLLPYYPEKEPFYNWICVFLVETMAIKESLVKYPLTFVDKVGKFSLAVYSDCDMRYGELFSGYYYDNEKLIVETGGSNRRRTDESYCGNYTLIEHHINNVSISNDYFGLGKIYYYSFEGIVVVSSRFHLLLEALLELNVDIELDDDIVLATFASLPPFRGDSFSEKLMIRSTYCLPAGYGLVFSEKGVQKKIISDIYSDFSSGQDRAYDEMLEETAGEIINHISAITASDATGRIVCDLTGGIDSRTVFAALTSMTERTCKSVYFHTSTPKREQVLANSLANMFGYEYDIDLAQKFILQKGNMEHCFSDHLDMLLSHFIGVYFEPQSFWLPMKKNRGITRLSGGAGELYRPYYNGKISENLRNNYKSTLPDCGKVKDFVADMTKEFERFHHYPKEQMEVYKTILTESILKSPGNNILQKYENMFMLYYNRFHFDRSMFWGYGIPIMLPGQTKCGYRLRQSTFSEYPNKKQMFDTIRVMNPIAAIFPYIDDSYNAERAKIYMETTYKEWERRLNLEVFPDLKLEITKENEDEGESDCVWDSWEMALNYGLEKHIHELTIDYLTNISNWKDGIYEKNICVPTRNLIKQITEDYKNVSMLHIIYQKVASLSYIIEYVKRSERGNAC